MIDCDKAKGFISYYIEKSLTPDLKSELDLHFKQCDECSLILNRMPQLQGLLKNINPIHCSEDFSIKLRKKIAANQNQTMALKPSFRKMSYGFSFAILIFAIIFGFNFFNQIETVPEVQLPQVQKQESIIPSNSMNSNIQQTTTNNLSQSGELNVRTKDSEGISTDSTQNNADEIKDPNLKYVDSK